MHEILGDDDHVEIVVGRLPEAVEQAVRQTGASVDRLPNRVRIVETTKIPTDLETGAQTPGL